MRINIFTLECSLNRSKGEVSTSKEMNKHYLGYVDGNLFSFLGLTEPDENDSVLYFIERIPVGSVNTSLGSFDTPTGAIICSSVDVLLESNIKDWEKADIIRRQGYRLSLTSQRQFPKIAKMIEKVM